MPTISTSFLIFDVHHNSTLYFLCGEEVILKSNFEKKIYTTNFEFTNKQRSNFFNQYFLKTGTHVVVGGLFILSSGGEAGLGVGLLSTGVGRLLALFNLVVTKTQENIANKLWIF